MNRLTNPTGIPDETREFSRAAEEFLTYCIDNDIHRPVMQTNMIDIDIPDDANTFIDMLIHNVDPDEAVPDDIATDLIQTRDGFNKRYEELINHLTPRVNVLVEHTSLSEREAQAYLLDMVPAGETGETGVWPAVIQLVISKIAGRDELITRQTVDTYRNRAEDKINEGMRTRYLTQFLGHPPEGYPAIDIDWTPTSTVPVKSSTHSKLRDRQRRGGPGTTLDDVIAEAIEETWTVKPLAEFIEEYMDNRPAVGVAFNTNIPTNGNHLYLNGIVSSDHNYNTVSTHPLDGIHESQNPERKHRIPLIRNTDAVTFHGTEYRFTFGESVGFDSEYMRWICSNSELDGPNPNRPDIDVADGLDGLTAWIQREVNTHA